MNLAHILENQTITEFLKSVSPKAIEGSTREMLLAAALCSPQYTDEGIEADKKNRKKAKTLIKKADEQLLAALKCFPRRNYDRYCSDKIEKDLIEFAKDSKGIDIAQFAFCIHQSFWKEGYRINNITEFFSAQISTEYLTPIVKHDLSPVWADEVEIGKTLYLDGVYPSDILLPIIEGLEEFDLIWTLTFHITGSSRPLHKIPASLLELYITGPINDLSVIHQHPKIRSLALTNTGVKTLSKIELPELQVLELTRCSKFVDYPTGFPKLQKLEINRCAITAITPDGFQGQCLKRLDIDTCPGITTIPDEIGSLHKLEELFLVELSLQSMSAKVADLKLENLILYRTSIEEWPVLNGTAPSRTALPDDLPDDLPTTTRAFLRMPSTAQSWHETNLMQYSDLAVIVEGSKIARSFEKLPLTRALILAHVTCSIDDEHGRSTNKYLKQNLIENGAEIEKEAVELVKKLPLVTAKQIENYASQLDAIEGIDADAYRRFAASYYEKNIEDLGSEENLNRWS